MLTLIAKAIVKAIVKAIATVLIILVQATIVVVIQATITIITPTKGRNIQRRDPTTKNSLIIETIIGENIQISLVDITIQAILLGRTTIKRTITKEIIMVTRIAVIGTTIHQGEMEE